MRTFAPFGPEKLTEQYRELESEVESQLGEEGFEEEEDVTIE